MTVFGTLVPRLTAASGRRPQSVVPHLGERSQPSGLLIELAIQEVFAEMWDSRCRPPPGTGASATGGPFASQSDHPRVAASGRAAV